MLQKRLGGSLVLAPGAAMASSHGNASDTPVARRKVRRLISQDFITL